MSSARHYDFAVIGGGSAGYAAARTAHSLGLKTVVIDGSEELGGLCILRGCMPSKTLIESANRNLSARHAEDFGLSAKVGEADIAAIRKRKRFLISDFAGYRQQQLQDGRFDLIRGYASFVNASNDEVQLQAKGADETLQISARSVLVASGSSIQVPPIHGLQETGYWTSDTLLDADHLPESFIVLGGGAIALEMAHYLEGVGRQVTIIQRSKHLLTGMDEDLASTVESAFRSRGMAIHTGTKLQHVEKTSRGKKVAFELHEDDSTVEVEAAELLVALGRKPALKGLNIELLNLEVDQSGHLVTSSTQQTSHPRIFAAGDVSGPLEVVHLAIQQAEIAAKNAAQVINGDSPAHNMSYRCKLYGVFTEPQVAAVGLSEAEAREKKIPYISASYPFNDHGKSMVMGEVDGFVKLLADPQTGEFLGASVVGPEATELIHQPAIALHLRATAEQFLNAPWYHPTLSEIWSYPAEEIADAVKVQSDQPKNDYKF